MDGYIRKDGKVVCQWEEHSTKRAIWVNGKKGLCGINRTESCTRNDLYKKK